jgi:hypothetical protein
MSEICRFHSGEDIECDILSRGVVWSQLKVGAYQHSSEPWCRVVSSKSRCLPTLF